MLLLFSVKSLLAQQVTIDNNVSLQDLVQNNLVNGCVEISNISSSVNGTADGLSSYGAFQRGSSNFPLENGMVLSSGDAASGGNTVNNTNLDEGTNGWGTDPDFETALGVNNTFNATSIEFDITTISGQVVFNYIFASEEYRETFPCSSSDGFVMLYREANTTTPYQNLALVNGQATVVNNIHNDIYTPGGNIECNATNSNYFQQGNPSDTNYNGRTTLLSATANFQPGITYHVKLIVADHIDSHSDSAVFINAEAINTLELGNDIGTCAPSVTLNADINNSNAQYTWYRDGGVITGANNAIYNASQTGLYRVEVSAPGISCILEDEINVTIDTEIPISIPNARLCDDGSGSETFTLTDHNNQVWNAIQPPPASLSIRYYDDVTERNNNTNATISTTQVNAGASQTIYVRAEDTSSGCVYLGEFNITVNPKPAPIDQSEAICDNDNNPNGETLVNLTDFDNLFSNSTDEAVSYHSSNNGAEGNYGIVSSPYFMNTPNVTLHVRVYNSVTGCHGTAILTLNQLPPPNTNPTTQYLDGCDKQYDGYHPFNLEDVLTNILPTPSTGLTPTFHTTYQDAQDDQDPITDPTNYTNASQYEEIIYVRVENDTTGCFSITPLRIFPNLLLDGINIPSNAPILYCDNNEDGEEEIFINSLSNYITSTVQEIATEISIKFYTDSSRSNASELPAGSSFMLTGLTTLYLTLERNGCTEETEIELDINPFTVTDPQDTTYCDTNSDGVTSIDLYTLDSHVTNGNTGISVRYFQSETYANDGTNQIYTLNNVSGTQTLYVQLVNNSDIRCFKVRSFNLEIIPAPDVNQVPIQYLCNDGTSSSTTVDLNDYIDDIINGNPADFSISFYDVDPRDPNNTATPLSNSNLSTYDTAIRNQLVFAEVTDNTGTTTCPAYTSIRFIVSQKPVPATVSQLPICTNTNTAPTYRFVDFDPTILNGNNQNEVLYFKNDGTPLVDATPIYKYSYYSPVDGETIQFVVRHISNVECNTLGSFTVTISFYPEYNQNFTRNLVPECRNGDYEHEFDLIPIRQDIESGAPNPLSVRFWETFNEADNASTPDLGDQFFSAERQGVFYARIENANDSRCPIIETISYEIYPTPLIDAASIAPSCALDSNSTTAIFDLSTASINVPNVRQGFDIRLEYNFYEGMDSNNKGIAPIASSDINNYSSSAKTIYVEAIAVSNNSNNELCRSNEVFPLQLQVNIPPSVFSFAPYPFCETDTNSVDLSEVDTHLVSSAINSAIVYYDSNNTEITNKQFNYNVLGSYTITAAITDNDIGCTSYADFEIVIYPNPIANIITNPTECNDDYEPGLEFQLEDYDDAIRGSQDPAIYSVTYYDDIDKANTGYADDQLDKTAYEAYNGQTIYARLENENTNCYSTTQFQTIINPLPVVPLDDVIPLCHNDLPAILNADTGNPTDTYEWWDGRTTSAISVDLTDLGDHWVTVTTDLGCSYKKEFTLIESEQATLEATATADFTDPNTITVTVSGLGDYQFALDGGTPQDSNIFNNVSLGPHIVTIIDLNGCEPIYTDVFVIDIPKFVTPNNDGAFDTWHIVGIDRLPGTQVYIYNRHGKLIKMLPYTAIGWDGTFNGQPMPADDYWFSADIIHNGEAFNIRGHFALKR
nr:T9SS type B sorting domain-containing protein [Aestuariivivens insulae]